jgi:N-acetyl-gamma-glutamyl-phosphate reductase
MTGLQVCILGATGYAGQECLRLLRHHPHVQRCDTPRSGEGLAGVATDVDVVLLATPAEAAADLAWPLVQRGHRVIDLSGAHRSGDPQAHRHTYAFDHPHPDALEQAVYGFAAPSLSHARLVANPGCYANGMLSALWPLQQAGLLAPGAVADVTGISGVSGAGRKASERTMFMTVADNLSPYKILRTHPHVTEVERALPLRLLFTPLVAPLRRGMLLSGTVQGRAGLSVDSMEALAFPQDPLWQRAPEPPDVHGVAETAWVRVHWALDEASGRIAFVSVLDNLLRGAASHAVVQMNRLFGLEDLSGLDGVLESPT